MYTKTRYRGIATGIGGRQVKNQAYRKRKRA